MGRHRITNWVIKNAVGAYDAIVGASGTITTDKVPVGQADGTVIWDDPPGGTGGLPWINVMDHGATGDGATDDSGAIQDALDTANAGTGTDMRVVYVPEGTYMLETQLLIYSNTHLLLASNARIKRNAAITHLLRSSGAPAAGGYGGDHDIIVEGGIWDGNASGFASAHNILGFAHCKNITVKDARLTAAYGYHFIELNGVQHGQVLNCEFSDHTSDGVNQGEAIQLDLMKSSSQWSGYGPYDDTPCDDILIQGNRFDDVTRAIGTHASSTSVRHTGIRILGNRITTCASEAITGLNWQDVEIADNTMATVGWGVRVNSDNATACSNIAVRGNTIRNLTGDSPNNIGIFFDGQASGMLSGVTVANNTIHTGNRHGIQLDNCHDSTVSGNTVGSVGTGASTVGSGIALTACLRVTISGNAVADTVVAGIHITSACVRCSAVGNTVKAGGQDGVLVNGSHYTVVSGNVITASQGLSGSSGHGIVVLTSNYCAITGNIIDKCQEHGIWLLDCDHNLVSGNTVAENSQRTDNTYDGILLDGDSDSNSVQGNVVRRVSGSLRHRYGIRVDDSTCNTNLVTCNDLLTSGQTGSYSDAGTGTVTTAANRT